MEEITRHTLSATETAAAGEIVVGPKTVLRERGAATSEKIAFPVSDPADRYLLSLANGGHDGSGRVASASIRLNGREIVSPQEFNSKIADRKQLLPVRPGENLLEISPHGMPGTTLTATIARLDPSICRAMGPRTFVSTSATPHTDIVEFPLLPQLGGPYTLRVMKGNPDGEHGTDAVTVTLNQIVVLDLPDLQATSIERTVQLLPSNKLEVHFFGTPGDHVIVDILGRDTLPPIFNVDQPLATVTTGEITVQGRIDDPSVVISVNGTAATVAPNGHWIAKHVALSEGENRLEVIAIDSCGNRQVEQVVVPRG
jgi:hypothetical protein